MILSTYALRRGWQQQPIANTRRSKPHRATLKAGLWDEPPCAAGTRACNRFLIGLTTRDQQKLRTCLLQGSLALPGPCANYSALIKSKKRGGWGDREENLTTHARRLPGTGTGANSKASAGKFKRISPKNGDMRRAGGPEPAPPYARPDTHGPGREASRPKKGPCPGENPHLVGNTVN